MIEAEAITIEAVKAETEKNVMTDLEIKTDVYTEGNPAKSDGITAETKDTLLVTNMAIRTETSTKVFVNLETDPKEKAEEKTVSNDYEKVEKLRPGKGGLGFPQVKRIKRTGPRQYRQLWNDSGGRLLVCSSVVCVQE